MTSKQQLSKSHVAANYIPETTVYDVVIMGAGWAGNCQARHLLLNIPNISIAIVDPRSPERESVKDLTIGESTVEIAADFMMKDLGLYDYLIENHAPKHGLSFHWPKNPENTNTVDDYFNIWSNGLPPTESFQLNRAKFEQDLLQMNRDKGATFYQGKVVDMDLTPGDELHTVAVKLKHTNIALKARHIADATGRRFLIGKDQDNIIFDTEKLYGLNTGSAWVHVKGSDRSFVIKDGYDPDALASHYYTTNHWFGHGHWIWMLPLGKSGDEMSIGIVYHKDIISTSQLNNLQKFKQFLKANHTVLYNLIESAQSTEFRHLPRIAHKSKTMISQDNWYVLGDAAHMFDPFYSPGLSLTAIAVESATEAIRAKLAGEKDACQKQEAFNRYLLMNAETFNFIYQKHDKHLGNACAMSWRTYMEDMLWFGILVPTYIGKWFLDSKFIGQNETFLNFLFFNKNSLFNDVYSQLDKIVERNLNVGLMDFTREDQLIAGYGPLHFFDSYLKQTKFEPQRLNVFAGIKGTLLFFIVAYLKLRFKAFGLLGVLAPKSIAQVIKLFALAFYSAIGEQIFKFKTRNVPANTKIANLRQEVKSYHHEPRLVPWNLDSDKVNDRDMSKTTV